jgi:hypothetical protein
MENPSMGALHRSLSDNNVVDLVAEVRSSQSNVSGHLACASSRARW